MNPLWSLVLLDIFWTFSVNCQDSVNYQNSTVTITEGGNVTLYCRYQVSTFYGLGWYRLNPGGGPELILYAALEQYKSEGRFTVEFQNKGGCSLHIQHPGVSDSSLYLCSVEEGGNYKLVFGTGTTLTVKPKTEQKDPSVYKLKSSKQGEGLPNFVCLVTDFPNPQTNLTVDGIESSLSATAVLDKSTNDVWRYSTVVWDNNNDVDCRMRYGDGNEIYPKSDPENAEETCSSLSIDASFRTNPSLNTLSQTVLGWRALTAKAIIFNLIITLRLWSS